VTWHRAECEREDATARRKPRRKSRGSHKTERDGGRRPICAGLRVARVFNPCGRRG
jgi:hypothetical protein